MSTIQDDAELDNSTGFAGAFSCFVASQIDAGVAPTEEDVQSWQLIYFMGAAALLELLETLRPAGTDASMAQCAAQISSLQQEIEEYLLERQEEADDLKLTAHVDTALAGGVDLG